MEALSQGLTRRGFLLGALVAMGGCTPFGKLPSMADSTPKPVPACQVVVTWSNKVHLSPDTVNSGVPSPGIVARMYLFGDRIDYPQVGDGSIEVDLFNDSGPKPGEQPLERWHIDADTLRRLLRKDTIGWGYTLFLPWGSCNPAVTRVRMTLRYDPRNSGTPLYSATSALTLEHPNGPLVQAETPRPMPPTGPPAAPIRPISR